MNASVRDGTTGDYWTKVNAVGGGDFYDIFSDSMGDSKTHARLCDANAAWIKTWTNVSLVSETQLESEYDELAKSIPDLDIRKKKAMEAVPWQYKRIGELVDAAGQSEPRLTALDAVSHDGINYPGYHLVT